jgi:hypothetical protein
LWLARCKITSVPSCWAARLLARAQCRRRCVWIRRFAWTTVPSAALKLTTSRYYTPSGKSIQAKGIVPDVMIDESEEGNLFAALRTREADLQKHLNSGQGEEVKDGTREKAREEARKKLEDELKKPAAERKMRLSMVLTKTSS